MSDEKKTNPLPDIEFLQRIEELENQVKELQKKVDEKEEQLLRAMADLQNVRRRSEEDRIRLPQIGMQKIVEAVLPTLDHLEIALKNTPEEKNDWIRGVESIFQGCFVALGRMNISAISDAGVSLDPNIHEVLSLDEEGKEGTVTEILQTGYKMGDVILRPAKVRAGSKK